MGRMVEQLRAVGVRRAALLLAVVALAASIAYVGGREAGVGERSEAGTVVAQEQPADAAQQGDGEEAGGVEPLTLTLSAPEICEASHPKGFRAHDLEWDEEEEVWRDVFFKWWSWVSSGTMEISWVVDGGDAPYTVMIAGETYSGANGIAEVSCALEHGPILDHPQIEVQGRLHGERGEWGRIHSFDDKPVVGSGVKTVAATVTDGAGVTAEATTQVYALLSPNGDHVLRAGETYRIQEGDDWLITIPDGVEGECCGYVQTACEPIDSDGVLDESVVCENGIHIVINGPGYRALLTLGEESVSERGRTVRLHDSTAPDVTKTLRHARRALDDLLASVGQPPLAVRGTP